MQPAGAAGMEAATLPHHLLTLIAGGQATEQWALYATAIAALDFVKAKGAHTLRTARDETLADRAELIACLAIAIMRAH